MWSRLLERLGGGRISAALPDNDDPSALADTRSRGMIDDLSTALESVLRAQQKRYLMTNVPRERLDEVREVIPGLSGPTIVEVLDSGGGGGTALDRMAPYLLRGETDALRFSLANAAKDTYDKALNQYVDSLNPSANAARFSAPASRTASSTLRCATCAGVPWSQSRHSVTRPATASTSTPAGAAASSSVLG